MSMPDHLSPSAPIEFPPWEVLAERRVEVNRFFRYRVDHVRLPSGIELPTFVYLDYPGASVIVPVTATGEIVLIRQYRHNLRQTVWEVPAGGLEENETPAENARKELREEIGGKAASMEFVGQFFTSPGRSNAVTHVFLARGVQLGERQLEATEQIAVVPVPIREAMRMVRSGEISGGPSALALLLCEPLLTDGSI